CWNCAMALNAPAVDKEPAAAEPKNEEEPGAVDGLAKKSPCSFCCAFWNVEFTSVNVLVSPRRESMRYWKSPPTVSHLPSDLSCRRWTSPLRSATLAASA